MSRIFVGQSALRIQLTVGQDVTNAQSVKIHYLKPDGTTGSWTAIVLTAATGVIYYDVTLTTTIDQRGEWKFWAAVTFSDGRVGISEAVEQFVYNAGEV